MRIGLVAVTLLALTSSSRASTIYEFHQDGTGDVLATLELSALPATESEVVSLAFTPAGDAIFGLGELYDGTFDSSAKSFVDDGSGLLVSSEPDWGANIEDTTPEETSSVIGDLAWVILGTSDPGQHVDVIYLEGANFDTRVFANGSFLQVPEPSTCGLLTLALTAAGLRRRTA